MLEEKGFDEIFEFRNVLEQMIEKIDEHKDYDSEVLQALRLLKIYKPKY